MSGSGGWAHSTIRSYQGTLAQQDRIDDQQDFIRKPMFEQRRYQRGATREDKVRAVLRFDAANALDDVLSKAFEWAPFKTFRTVR